MGVCTLASVVVLTVGACTSTELSPRGSDADPWQSVDAGRGGADASDATGAPTTAPQQPRRAARRLDVSQMEAAVAKLLGVNWTYGTNGKEFTRKASIFGQPDYIQSTREDRSITPIVAKNLDDMAGQVCAKAVAEDEVRDKQSERVLIPYPDGVDRNLRWLRLKLHAIYVPGDSTDGIARLRKLYDDVVAATEKTQKGWEAVCVAMITAPEFIVY